MDVQYTDAGGRARAVTTALFVFIAASIAVAIGDLFAIGAIERFEAGAVGLEVLGWSDTIGTVTAVVYFIALLVAAILSCRWVLRVSSNAHLWAPDWMTMSPGWNVGYFFIPIASFYLPFRGIRETWQVSERPHDPAAVAVPALLRWWWAGWHGESQGRSSRAF